MSASLNYLHHLAVNSCLALDLRHSVLLVHAWLGLACSPPCTTLPGLQLNLCLFIKGLPCYITLPLLEKQIFYFGIVFNKNKRNEINQIVQQCCDRSLLIIIVGITLLYSYSS